MPQMAGAGVLAGYCVGKEDPMPTPQREPLRRMTRAERAVLRRIVNGSSERVDQVRRATALLAVAEGSAFIQAAWQAGLHSGTTVADLVGRFNRHGLAALRIATGRGRKPTYVASARARIVAMAQRTPNRRADGTATWSLSTLRGPCAAETFPRLARAPFCVCCKTPAARTSGRARGVRRVRRSA